MRTCAIQVKGLRSYEGYRYALSTFFILFWFLLWNCSLCKSSSGWPRHWAVLNLTAPLIKPVLLTTTRSGFSSFTMTRNKRLFHVSI